jgi:hypothetical protein
VAAASAIPRTRAVRRSLTLLRIFLVASAAILAAGAVLLSGILSGRLKAQVIDDTRSSLTQYVDACCGRNSFRETASSSTRSCHAG